MISLFKNSKKPVMGSELNKTIAELNKQRPQKIQRGLVTQAGTAAPAITSLINELGGTIAWVRTSAGLYTGTLTGKFLVGKCTFNVTKAGADDAVDIALGRATDNTVVLTSKTGGVATDGLINAASFLIELWP